MRSPPAIAAEAVPRAREQMPILSRRRTRAVAIGMRSRLDTGTLRMDDVDSLDRIGNGRPSCRHSAASHYGPIDKPSITAGGPTAHHRRNASLGAG